MTKEDKAEEILKKHIVDNPDMTAHALLVHKAILSAMQEYASQFTSQKSDASTAAEAAAIQYANTNYSGGSARYLASYNSFIAGAEWRGGGWQPISTAPKDGTEIIVYRPFAKEHGDDTITIVETQDYPSFDHKGVEYFTERSHHPTHWQPLPTPPIEQTIK